MKQTTRLYRFSCFEIQVEERRLLKDGNNLELGAKAFDLLVTLAENAGRLLSKTELLEAAWPNLVVEENNVNVQISILRKLLGAEAITTVFGSGFRFTPEVIFLTLQQNNDNVETVDVASVHPAMKIILVDDHSLIRDALRGVINELIQSATMVEAINGHQAHQYLEDDPNYHLIFLDLGLPDCDGFELLKKLRAQYPLISIVVISAEESREKIMNALNCGVVGFIPKTTAREVMVNAIRLILSGGTYIPPQSLMLGGTSPLST
ncbi:MAG: response regulator [Pseudomonadota bacterium]